MPELKNTMRLPIEEGPHGVYDVVDEALDGKKAIPIVFVSKSSGNASFEYGSKATADGALRNKMSQPIESDAEGNTRVVDEDVDGQKAIPFVAVTKDANGKFVYAEVGGGSPDPGSVGTSALEDGAVTTPKIADGAVTDDKLATPKVDVPDPLVPKMVIGTTLETAELGVVGYSQEPMADQLVMYQFGGQIAAADPAADGDAATKKYVDDQIAAIPMPTAADISDASAVGRSVLTATDAAAARTAIGAGTSDQNILTMTLQEAQEGTVTTGRAISPQVLRASMPNLSSVAMLNQGATLEEAVAKINEIIQTISP